MKRAKTRRTKSNRSMRRKEKKDEKKGKGNISGNKRRCKGKKR